MPAIDEFAGRLLEEAKRFLELAADGQSLDGQTAYLHASLLLGFSALEAHANAVADDFVARPDLSSHERAFLLERDVKLEDGEFKVTEGLRMIRLDERLQFLHRRFSASAVDRNATWWADLKNAIKLRNELTHPKGATVISMAAVSRAIQAVIDTIDALYQAVYKTKFPAASRGLQSKFDF